MSDDRDTKWVTVDAILATDELLPTYGGFKLAREALDGYAESFMRRDHLTIAHDSTRPIAIRNVVAGVRLNAAGNHEVWASFEAAAAGWVEFEAERIAHGAPGGFSFTHAERYGEVRAHPTRAAADHYLGGRSPLQSGRSGDSRHGARTDC